MLKVLVVAFALIAVAVGSFFVARALLPEGTAKTEAQPPVPTPPSVTDLEERKRLLDEDAQKPRFTGVVNGIRLYYDGPERQGVACTGSNGQFVPVERAQGSPLDIRPSYLPVGAREAVEAGDAVECAGAIGYVAREYWSPAGSITITRHEGEHAMSISAPAERILPATIRGRNAVVIEAIIPDQLTHAEIIVAEEFGVTVVAGDANLAELIKVAEGLQ